MSNPTLRFKSANGLNFPDTVSCTLSDISKYSKGTIERKNCLFIGNEQLVSNFGGATLEFRTEAKGTKFNNGDILFGNIRPYLKKVWLSDQSGIASPDVLIFKVTDSIPGYLKCILSSERFFNHVAQGYKGSKMPRGDKHQIMDFRIQCPCLEEQQKIASFFSTLDQKIELNERKLEALEKLKKGLMQKIFSQNIRFKNSDGTNYPEWRTARFFDIVESIIDFRGRTPKKLGLDWAPSATEYLALSALNVKNWGIDTSAEAHYGDEKLYKKWMTGKELHKGQVLLTTEAPAGIVMQIPDEKKYILSQRVIALNVKQDSISEVFLSQLLKSEKVQQDIRKLSTGGTAIGISQKSLRNLYLYFPSSIQEQQAIGNLFVSLDDKLQLTKKRVEKLQALKRGFMQQMFV